MQKICLIMLVLIFYLSASQLRTPAEIIEITEKSKVIYQLSPLDTTIAKPPDTAIIRPDLMISSNNTLINQSLSEDLEAEFLQAEKYFSEKSFKLACEKYLSVYKKAPDFSRALTLAGNSYFALGEYRKAKKSFIKSIKKNFYSYQAHWFLASTYYQMGDVYKATKEIVIAHLLNRNHPEIKKVLIGMSEAMTTWNDWSFNPLYDISKESDTVKVLFAPGWFGWAITMAAWEYEPGYRDVYDSTNSLAKYQEALLGYLAENTDNTGKVAKMVRLIVERKTFTSQFLIYEVLLPKNPEIIYQLSRESFEAFQWYIRIFHQHKIDNMGM